MVIKTGKENIKTQYNIHGITITKQFKYLGLLLNDQMNPSEMITQHLKLAEEDATSLSEVRTSI